MGRRITNGNLLAAENQFPVFKLKNKQIMALEIKIGDRKANVELISQQGNLVTVNVDGKAYELDLMMVEEGVYSILYNNISYNVELIEKRITGITMLTPCTAHGMLR